MNMPAQQDIVALVETLMLDSPEDVSRHILLMVRDLACQEQELLAANLLSTVIAHINGEDELLFQNNVAFAKRMACCHIEVS